MAQRSQRQTKATQAPKPRETRAAQNFEETAVSNVGENAAPDNPSHLMPSPQASGATFTTDDPKERDLGDDLSDEELEERGYPDPEKTPDHGMSSTRHDDRTMAEVDQDKVATTHKMLDEKLDSINEQRAAREQLDSQDDEDVDYANLPNAPKGDDVLVLGPDEPLRVSGDEQGNYIILDKSIYRARRPFRSVRWAFTLEYMKGAQIPSSKVRSVPVPVAKESEKGTQETKENKPPLEKTGEEQENEK